MASTTLTTPPATPSTTRSPGATPYAVQLDDVDRTYRSRSGTVDALRGVSLGFERGTFTAIMGPSGSGKSTLLQVAAGLDRPTRGRVLVAGHDLGRLNQTKLTELRRAAMGFVFQSYNLLDALSAHDNVALPARLAGRSVRTEQVLAALDAVGLRDLARRRPPELSGGQQQRVALARALHTRPAVLFADEPTGALDRASGRQVLELFRSTTDLTGQTVVMVTHDPLAASYADQVLFLADGQVVGRLPRTHANEIAAAMAELEGAGA